MKACRAATVQFNHTPGDVEANWQSVHASVNRAADRDVDLGSLPELCLTGY